MIIVSFLSGCQGRQDSAGEEVPDQVSQAPSGSDHPDPGLIPPDDRNPTDMQHGSKQHALLFYSSSLLFKFSIILKISKKFSILLFFHLSGCAFEVKCTIR